MATNNQQPLLRDPKSGRRLSRLESDLKRAQIDAAAFGQEQSDRQLTEYSMLLDDDSPNVHRYTQELVGVVRNYSGPAVKLRELLPLLHEVATLAEADKTLTKEEHKRVKSVHDWLVAFIARKSSVYNRVHASLKRLSKERMPEFRYNAAGQLQQSESGIARLAGRVLAPRSPKDGTESITQAILNARASVLQGAADAKKLSKERLSVKPQHDIEVDVPPMSEPVPPKPPKKVKRVKKSDEESDSVDMPRGTSASVILEDILQISHKIADKLDVTNQLLRTGREDMIQLEDAKERKKNEKDESKVMKVKNPDEKESGDSILGKLFGSTLFSGVRGAFDNILKWFGAGSLLARVVMPALSLLGQGAAVIGAAWVGWKVGDWLSQLMGLGSSSEALAKLMDGSQSALETAKAAWAGMTGKKAQQTANAKEDTIRFARQHAREMGRIEQPTTYDEAIKVNDEWNAWKKAQVAQTHPPATPVKKPVPTQPVIDADSWVMPTQPMPTATSRLTPEALPTLPANDAPKKVGKRVESASLSMAGPDTKVQKEKKGKQDAKTLTVSDAGLSLIKKFEGFRAQPYWDTNGYAIGYGSHELNGQSVDKLFAENPKLTISEEEATRNLKDRLESDYLPYVRRALKRPVTQAEFDSLASVAWNRGSGAFTKDKSFIQKVNDESVTKDDFMKTFTLKNPKVTPFLAKRREQEFAVFAGEQPSSNRAVGQVAALTKAAGPSTQPIVNITTPPAQTHDVRTHTIIPMRIETHNTDDTLRAIRAVNTI